MVGEACVSSFSYLQLTCFESVPITIEPVLDISFVASVLWEDKNLLCLSLFLEYSQVSIISEFPWVPAEQDFWVIISRAAQFLDLLCLYTLHLQSFSEINVSVSQTHLIVFDDWFWTLLCCCIFESNGTRSSCSLKWQCFASCFILLDGFSPAGESLYHLSCLFGVCFFKGVLVEPHSTAVSVFSWIYYLQESFQVEILFQLMKTRLELHGFSASSND